jgi:hypothetical protein
MEFITIKRPDGMGYQISERYLTKMMSEKVSPDLKYVHTKIDRAEHICEQECIDYIYKQITGTDNVSEITDVNNTYIGNNYHKTIKENTTGNDKMNWFFMKDWFKDIANEFNERHKHLNVFDNKCINIVIHIRKGDIADKDHPRLLDNDFYINQHKKCIEELSGDIRTFIETDSPQQVSALAEELNAQVNCISNKTADLISADISDDWKSSYYFMQSVYNIAAADIFIPSRSRFSLLGYILSVGDVYTPEIKTFKFDTSKFLPIPSVLGFPDNPQKLQANVRYISFVKFIHTKNDVMTF